MRSEFSKAAWILGICLILSSALLVLGMRWAIGSALASHLPGLNRTVSETGNALEASLEKSSADLEGVINRTGTDLATSVEAAAVRVDSSVDDVSNGITRTNETISASSNGLNQTFQRAFETPLLVRAPEPLPIVGPEEEGPPLNVDASILGGSGGERRSQQGKEE